MIEAIILAAAVFGGYAIARNFVSRRLRFVDAVQSPLAPLVAGVVAAVIAWPLALLPMVTGVTAVAFGVGAGLGTASGVRHIRHGDGSHRRLAP
ncbi:MAG: hypothetical protein ACREMG_14310 [Gemmatimonadales bacterium]